MDEQEFLQSLSSEEIEILRQIVDRRKELKEVKRQQTVLANREARTSNRAKYRRNGKDRRRTHHLIQYGAAIESQHRELSYLTDVEVYRLIENILESREVEQKIREAVIKHKTDHPEETEKEEHGRTAD